MAELTGRELGSPLGWATIDPELESWAPHPRAYQGNYRASICIYMPERYHRLSHLIVHLTSDLGIEAVGKGISGFLFKPATADSWHDFSAPLSEYDLKHYPELRFQIGNNPLGHQLIEERLMATFPEQYDAYLEAFMAQEAARQG